MAIFKKKTQEKTIKTESRALSVPTHAVSSARAVSDVVIRPKLTEKISTLEAKQPVYLFEVRAGAAKPAVSAAIAALYKVKPVKVAIVRIPPKKSLARGRAAYGATTYKAYVYLKKGDKIEVA